MPEPYVATFTTFAHFTHARLDVIAALTVVWGAFDIQPRAQWRLLGV